MDDGGRIADVHEIVTGAVFAADGGDEAGAGDVAAGALQTQAGVPDEAGEADAEQLAGIGGCSVGEGQDDPALGGIDGQGDIIRIGPCGAGLGACIGQDLGIVGQDQLAVGNDLLFRGQDVDPGHAIPGGDDLQIEGGCAFRSGGSDAQIAHKHHGTQQENKPFLGVSHRFTSLEYYSGFAGIPSFLKEKVTDS